MPSLTSSSDGIEGGQYLRRISNEREVLFQNEEEAELASAEVDQWPGHYGGCTAHATTKSVAVYV